MIQSRINSLFPDDPNIPVTPLTCVQRILRSISANGDKAIIDWTKRIDRVDIDPGDMEVSKKEIDDAMKGISGELLESLRVARGRIVKFHEKEYGGFGGRSWFTTGGDEDGAGGGLLGQLLRPLKSCGFYVPGGTAPLPSTVLMSVLPAVVAGVKELVVVSPPDRNNGGRIAGVTLAACGVVNEMDGVNIRVFRMGGAQAIGAIAYGTESVPRVDKIVGPGNVFVSLAKKEVFGLVGIDGIFGPTEALVIADDSANAKLVASDLLAQAEHDYLAIPILITPSETLAKVVQSEVEEQVEVLSRKEIARHSLWNQGGIVVASDLQECFKLANDFAAEHVSLSIENPYEHLGDIHNAGGLFLGENSCEVLGDYVAGPSHTMPTGGSARYSGPLSVLQFLKITSVIGLDRKSVSKVAPHAERIARAEGLDAHANAAKLRIDTE